MIATPTHLDLADMRRRLRDDELIVELFRMFLESYAAQLAAIEAAVTAGDLEATRESAHLMKSSAGNLSASELVDACAALEVAAERRESTDLSRHFRRLAFVAETLAVELQGLVAD